MKIQTLFYHPLEHRTSKLHRRLKKHHKDLESLIGIKGAKLISKIFTFPLEYLGIIHQDAKRVSRSSLGIVKGLIGIDLTNKSLKVKDDFVFHLQPTIHVNVFNEKVAIPKANAKPPSPLQQIDDTPLEIMQKLQKYTSLQEILISLKEVSKHLGSKIVNSLEKCISFEEIQAKLKRLILCHERKAFIKSLKTCESLDEVQKILINHGIKTIEIPSTYDRWKIQINNIRFKRHLIQTYYSSVGKRPFMNGDDIQNMLNKRALERVAKIKKASATIIQDHIKACETKDFPVIEQHFEKLHIRFNRIKPDANPHKTVIPPKSKAEWLTSYRHLLLFAMH